jgi:hypothetical protein
MIIETDTHGSNWIKSKEKNILQGCTYSKTILCLYVKTK